MHLPPNSIIYDILVDIHFSNFDRYGHVNSTYYLDIVTSSRFKYAEQILGLSAENITSKGIGFYMIRAEIDFLKPITRVSAVRVQSYATIQGSALDVFFEINNINTTECFARGTMKNVFIDLKKSKPTECPTWLARYFLKESVSCV